VWFERLSLEHDNLRAALRWSVEHGQPEIGLRIATSLMRFWEVRGHWSEGRGWYTGLLDQCRHGEVPTHLRAAALADSGLLANAQGDNSMAVTLFEEALHLARSADATVVILWALHGLGTVAYMQGDITIGRKHSLEALRLARKLQDDWGMARALRNLAWMAYTEGQLETARALYEEGLTIAEQAGERRIGSTIRIGLGGVARQIGDFSTAQRHLEAALETKRALGDTIGIAAAVKGLGWVAFENGAYGRAYELFVEALKNGPWSVFDTTVPSALLGLGVIAVRLDDHARAIRLFGAAANCAGQPDGQGEWVPDLKKRRATIAQARQAVGREAERLWSKGVALDRTSALDEARALAENLMNLEPIPLRRARRAQLGPDGRAATTLVAGTASGNAPS
jgi:tetratricopeptide (TPR) repeat protein